VGSLPVDHRCRFQEIAPDVRVPLRSRLAAAATLLLLVLPALAADPPPTPAWAHPEPVREARMFSKGGLSTLDFESSPAFAADGRRLWFVKSTPTRSHHSILFTQSSGGAWTTPEMLTFSGQWSDSDPHLAANDTKLYFASNRPAEARTGFADDDLDLFVTELWSADTWSPATRLPAPVNGPHDDFTPFVAGDGALWFASRRPGGKGGADLWRARPRAGGGWERPENLGGAINTRGDEFAPWVARDGSWVVFASTRPEGRGGTDLWVSRREGAKWSAPRNLGGHVNTIRDELSPVVTPDGKYFFWTSCRSFVDEPTERTWAYADLLGRLRMAGNGLGDFYQIELAELGLAR
jgi:hypothetical protein